MHNHLVEIQRPMNIFRIFKFALSWSILITELPLGINAFSIGRRPPKQPRRHCSHANSHSHDDSLSSEEVRTRLEHRLMLLREKDRTSRHIPIQNLSISYEDDHILVVEKPAGVICISDDPEVHSLARTVYDYCKQNKKASERISMDQMVVHRLGFETSGLMIFAKTLPAARNLHMLFRTRQITRQYEALVVGHVKNDQGLINLPLMRDYEHPPYMRISTKYHQQILLGLDAQIVGKKLMESPKASLTHYQVLKREYWDGDRDLPVTRLTLTSITGRTHQLNCHLAALGHPIVRDTVYGFQGTAAPFGGLEAPTQHAISNELQAAIANATRDSNMCVHAKLIRFVHPVTGQEVEYKSTPPF